MSILSFFNSKKKPTITDEQIASQKLYELIHEGKSSEEDIVVLSNMIYILAFKRTNKEPVNPWDAMDIRNLIGNPNGPRLIEYFNVIKAIKYTLSDIPDNPIYGKSSDNVLECDVLIDTLVRNMANEIRKIE